MHETADTIEALGDWLPAALRSFGARGFGAHATSLSADAVERSFRCVDNIYREVVANEFHRGIIVVQPASWEQSVLQRPVAEVSVFAASDFETACSLARHAVAATKNAGVVLLSAWPGHSPTFLHGALYATGFHVGSQSLMLRADLDAIWSRVERIPLRGSFRMASALDADAVGTIASDAFGEGRFTGDPFFPKRWGQTLYSEWAKNLARGAAESMVVAEGSTGILGFVSMSRSDSTSHRTPNLMAVSPRVQWGVGAMLVRKMLEWHRANGTQIFVGGTEKSNLAMNNLYHRLGFTVIDSNLVYHWTPMT